MTRSATDPGRLSADGITVRFGDVVALQDVSCEFKGRGVHGLIGVNGAGKTTLIHALLRLRPLSAGSVSTHDPTEAIGYCPDAPSFEAWLTADEVLEQSAALGRRTGTPPSPADREAVLERVGMARLRHRLVGGFSRGQRQRLGVAAALVRAPSVLILDEPTSALDPVGRAEMIELIGQLGSDAAVVFSSHILDDVERVADDLVVLHEGRLVYAGPASRFIDPPGSAATVRVSLRGDGAAVRARLEEAGVPTAPDDAQGRRLLVPEGSTAALFGVLAACPDQVLRVERTDASLQRAFLAAIDDEAEAA